MKSAAVSGKARVMPKGRPWQKGQSGNPGGRVRKFATLVGDAMRESLAEVDRKTQMTYATLFITRLRDIFVEQLNNGIASKELLLFLREVADRTEGKPPQRLEIDDQSGRSADERIEELLATASARAKAVSK